MWSVCRNVDGELVLIAFVNIRCNEVMASVSC